MKATGLEIERVYLTEQMWAQGKVMVMGQVLAYLLALVLVVVMATLMALKSAPTLEEETVQATD